MTDAADRSYASRAGRKLAHALDAFSVDVSGLACADLGSNVGGFTDCLLQHGADHVYSVETGYGVLAYPLRIDSRVTVLERTNALHVEPHEAVDLVVVDLGWTRQRHAVPAALRWLKPEGRIISLIKPHYEQAGTGQSAGEYRGGLDEAASRQVLDQVLAEMPSFGVTVAQWVVSPLTGSKSSRRRRKQKRDGQPGKSNSLSAGGNREYLALLVPTTDQPHESV